MSRIQMTPIRHALLLTAGLGTRLDPLTRVRAKPAVPVAGQPMIRRIIQHLASSGVREIVLNLHHLPHTIAAVVGNGTDLGVSVRYSWEQPVVLGSAGGPRHALPLVGADRFLIVNGDTLSDVDLLGLAAAHTSSGALVTLALTPNRAPKRYGGVLLDDRTMVTAFVPKGPDAIGSYHYIGVQVVEAGVFRDVEDGRPLASIGGMYSELVRSANGAIAGFVCASQFWDIGTVADYWRTSLAFAAADEEPLPGLVHPSAQVTRSILWDDIRIGAGCVVDECIVTDGVRLRAGSRHRRRILLGTGNGVRDMPLEIDT